MFFSLKYRFVGPFVSVYAIEAYWHFLILQRADLNFGQETAF